MKKHTVYKTIQLVLLLVLAATVILYIFPRADVYHAVANDPTVRLLAIVVWAVFIISFIFLYLDYAYFLNYRKEYHEIELAAGTDPESGIANRFSCDVMIEKYVDKPLPDGMGAIMIDLTNIQEINRLYGHLQGNVAIRDFSNILRLCSSELCFVGRNGGNKFLALFEDSSEENMQLFLDRVEQRVGIHNKNVTASPIKYACGSAFSGFDRVDDITRLISLANGRIPSQF